VFWGLAVVCGAVNLLLLLEMASTLATKTNLAQADLELFVIFVLVAAPALMVSISMLIYLLWKRSNSALTVPTKSRFVIVLSNISVPLLFLVFLMSVKWFGYYWVYTN
jgi:hypothetical protein